MDPVAARRGLAGAPIVHGIHLFFWALDAACAAGAIRRPITKISANFSCFVAVDEEVSLVVLPAADKVRLHVVSGGTLRVEIFVDFGYTAASTPLQVRSQDLVDRTPGQTAGDLPGAIEGFAGFVASASQEAAWSGAFPDAAGTVGAVRLATLGATTRLVGMVCPGLNSVYIGFDLMFDTHHGPSGITFEAQAPRHGLLPIKVAGPGLHGRLTTLIRPAPARQPEAAAFRGLLPADELSGHHALVIGGSRGLGEVTAKLLALSGARVTITYHRGEEDARQVAADISAAGGMCDVLSYDVRLPASGQLERVGMAPTHCWYFATARIGDPGSRFFDRRRFEALLAIHVEGFWTLAVALHILNPTARLFYPSSVFVDTRPAGFGEYAMVKAAAEILCGEIEATMAPMTTVVRRLPPLATDQNVTKTGNIGANPVEAILSIVAAMHGARIGGVQNPSCSGRASDVAAGRR